MNLEEKIERLSGVVESLAASVVAHDNQIEAHTRQIGAIIELAATQQRQIAAHDDRIEALIKISEENARNWKNLERQWQAYINTLPRQ
jgi:predicted RNase H-like nuclease (RuvC/YqgF family)